MVELVELDWIFYCAEIVKLICHVNIHQIIMHMCGSLCVTLPNN